VSVPQKWLDNIPDKDAFAEELHPDWQKKFVDADGRPDVDRCLDEYSNMSPDEFHEIEKRLR